MSVDLILWNSIAARRRSPSDTFLDNGLGMLKASLEKQGFVVNIVDWAQGSYWAKFTPKSLARLNRFLSSILLFPYWREKKLSSYLSKLIFPFFLLSQKLTSAFQKRSLDKMLRSFAVSLKDSGCRVFGVKTWYGEAYVTANSLAGLIKSYVPDILLISGGPHPSIYRETFLKDSVFDIAVTGEGEKALAGILTLVNHTKTKDELLKRIAEEVSVGNLKNIMYRNANTVALSDTDETDANEKMVPSYCDTRGKTKIHVVVEALGCPWGKCNFCVHSRIYPYHSLRNPRSVVDEINKMISQDIGIFRFAGSTSSLSHIREIARLLLEENGKIIYSMFARSESGASDQEKYNWIVETYRLLIRSGLRAVFIGGESSDDRILRSVINKGLTVDDIIATIKAMREASLLEGLPLDIGLSFIHPVPTMGIITLEELKEKNITLVEETTPDSVLVNPPAPFPGTSWYNNSAQFGFELGNNFTRNMLGYDYVLYKPPSLWPDINMKLEGMNFRQILAECQSLRKSLENKGFITEVTDEHFLMMRAAGYTGKEGARKFKNEVLLDIVSGDYRWITQLEEKVNQASKKQALLNMR